jgi:hypothetical protein
LLAAFLPLGAEDTSQPGPLRYTTATSKRQKNDFRDAEAVVEACNALKRGTSIIR